MKIALIHDYLASYGGSEKTFKVLSDIFPDAELYTLFYNKEIKNRLFFGKIIHTSFLQKFPAFFKKHYQWLLPLFPIATETIDLRNYDVVISSSHSFVKGIITRPKTTHICYCYSPTRYLWDKSRKSALLHYFRLWDRHASERVDHFIACSKTAQDRIKKYYKRDSIVVYPPAYVETSAGRPAENRYEEFYLIVSQLRKYKRIDLAVEAFNKLELELVIIGEGPEKRKLQRMANKNVKFLGFQSEEVVSDYFQKCTALVFPGEDDFGIAPVEAMRHGKPVLAYRKGGATETVLEGKTGEFFDYQNSAILADGIRRLRLNLANYDPQLIIRHAQKFSREKFEKAIKEFIEKFAKEG